MTSPNSAPSLPRTIALVVVTAVLIVGILAAGLIGGGMGACAAGAPGPRPFHLGPYISAFGPPLVTFFVLGYFALGARSRSRRLLALSTTLVVTSVVGAYTVLLLPVCGF